jgi:hypothetical protein
MDGLTGHGVDCDVTLTDAFLEPAGIELEMTYNWVIGPNLETSQGGSNEDYGFLLDFMVSYQDWLAANHSDVEQSIEYAPVPNFDGFILPTPESIPTALEYIDEFVTQSDAYPVTEPVPPGDYGGPLN